LSPPAIKDLSSDLSCPPSKELGAGMKLASEEARKTAAPEIFGTTDAPRDVEAM